MCVADSVSVHITSVLLLVYMKLKSDSLNFFWKWSLLMKVCMKWICIALLIPRTYAGSFIIEGIIYNELKIIDICKVFRFGMFIHLQL